MHAVVARNYSETGEIINLGVIEATRVSNHKNKTNRYSHRTRNGVVKVPRLPAMGVFLLAFHDILWSLMVPPAPAFRDHSSGHNGFPEPSHHGVSRLILSDKNLNIQTERISISRADTPRPPRTPQFNSFTTTARSTP